MNNKIDYIKRTDGETVMEIYPCYWEDNLYNVELSEADSGIIFDMNLDVKGSNAEDVYEQQKGYGIPFDFSKAKDC